MDPLFAWLEATAASVWLRESLSVFAFPTVLLLHTVGLAFVAGPCFAMSLTLLGAIRGVRPQTLLRLYPLVWAGFALNLATGLGLMLAYPTKALTNPLFYGKLLIVGIGLAAFVRLRRHLGGDEPVPVAVRLACLSSAAWILAIFAGRFLAYTYTRLLASH